MSVLPPPESKVEHADTESAWSHIHRYFFYSWLFNDADSGTVWERSAARRRNCEQAKWLPTYLLRWAVVGALLVTLEQLSEQLSGSSAMTAALAVSVILAATFWLITAVSWAFLRVNRSTR